MAGTMSIRRQRAAASAISFIEAHGEEIGTAANQATSIFYMPEETPVDYWLSLKVKARMLERRRDDVIAADEDHLDEQANDIEPTLELREAGAEVNAQLVFTRRMLTGFYGVELADKILATDGPAAGPDQPQLLWRQGKQTAERLRTTPFDEPKRTSSSFQFNPVALADELEPAVQRLERALAAVDLERRKIEATVNRKAEAIAAFDSAFRITVRFTVAVCLLAGKPNLARRLRASLLDPPRRRAGEGDGEPEEETPPGAGDPEEPAAADSETEQEEVS